MKSTNSFFCYLLFKTRLEPFLSQDWNYMVRLYRPRAQVLNGRWKFPEVELQ
jgi:hypothetical protein